MVYRIYCTTEREEYGRFIKATQSVYIKGWEVLVRTEDDARKVCDLLSPEDPYILTYGERDRPRYTFEHWGDVVKDVAKCKSIKDIVYLLEMNDYYDDEGNRRPDEEVY